MKLENYNIIEKIVSNPNKSVYRVTDLKGKVWIAKQLNFSKDNREEHEKLKKELQLTEGLDPHYVVKAIDLGEYEGCPFLIMEDKGGIDLKSYLQTHTLNFSEFIQIAIAMAECVNHVHIHNIVHLDVNPSNFIIHPQTKAIWLNDFGAAEYYRKQNRYQTTKPELKGTIEYISPEQTGRINATTDFRSDIYALGISFYEMCTGMLPFKGADLLSNIHLHIAVIPARPDQLSNQVPKQIGNIIMKMLAKEPSYRYQSLFGLLDDLKYCQKSFLETGYVQEFECGSTDRYSYFNYPTRIYGRSSFIKELNTSLRNSAKRAVMMYLIEGEAGVGKTFVVTKVLSEQKAVFCLFGAFNTGVNTPYASLVDALRNYFTQVLLTNDATLLSIKASLQGVLKDDHGLLTTLLPELKMVLLEERESSQLLDLGIQETQYRFYTQMAVLIRWIIEREGSLALIVDNIHQIDEASLGLFEFLIERAELEHFVLYGLAQSTSQSEILMRLRDKCESQSHLNYRRLELMGCTIDDLEALLFDLFSFDDTQCQVLSDIVFTKTNGIPLFVYEMLKSLYVNNLIFFDTQMAKWSFNLNDVRQFEISDNVMELVYNRVARLSGDELDILKIASCFDGPFTLENMMTISGYDEMQLVDILTMLVDNEFIIFDSSVNDLIFKTNQYRQKAFSFPHNGVRQIVNRMVDPEEEQLYQFKIGLEALNVLGKKHSLDQMVRVANCFNAALSLMKDPVLRREAADINMVLAQQARNSGAFEQATHYISYAVQYLESDAFTQTYELAFRVYLLKAELEYLTKLFNSAESDFKHLLNQVKSPYDLARINKLRMTLYINQGETESVVELALGTLKALDLELKKTPSPLQVAVDLIYIRSHSNFRKIYPLEHLQTCHEVRIQLIMEILMTLTSVSYLMSPLLFIEIILTMIKLSLKYGNTPYSAFAYATFGIVEGNIFKQYRRAFDYGEMSLRLAKRFKQADVLSQTYFTMGFFLNHWVHHVREALPYLNIGKEQSELCGDMVFYAYNIAAYHLANATSSAQLDEMLDAIRTDLKRINEIQVRDVANLLIAVRQLVLNLKGLTKSYASFDTEDFSQRQFELELRESKMPSILAVYLVLKTKIHYLYDQHEEASTFFEEGDQLFKSLMGLYQSVEYLFYQTLTLLKVKPGDPRIAKNIRKLMRFSQIAPSNFEHMYLIVKGEQHRTNRRYAEAKRFFDQALKVSHQNDFMMEEALCSEFMASIYAQEGNVKLRKLYLHESFQLFYRMGAKARLDFMIAKYKEIVFDQKTMNLTEVVSFANTSIKTSSERFDLMGIVKSTQNISAFTDENALIEETLKILMQLSNADRVVLIVKSDLWMVKAIADGPDRLMVLQSEPAQGSLYIPETAINFSLRTEQPLILDMAETNTFYSKDPYYQRHSVKSALCLPVLSKETVMALAYFENALLSGAFHQSRLEPLNVILSQFLISYENAQLIQSLEQSEAEIRFHKEHLENLVSKRTSELSLAKHDIEEIMNNVDQGFMQFDQNGRLLDGYSHECVKLYGQRIDHMSFDELFNQGQKNVDQGFYNRLVKRIFEADSDFSASVYVGLLPEMLTLNGRQVQVHYKRVQHQFNKRLIVVLTDMTDRLRLERERETEKHNLKKIVNMIKYQNNLKKNIEDFKRFFEGGYQDILGTDQSTKIHVKEIYRTIHTFKGDFAQWSMNHLSDGMHQLEDHIVQIQKRPHFDEEDILSLLENYDYERALEEEFNQVTVYTGKYFLESEQTLTLSKSELESVVRELSTELTPKGLERLQQLTQNLYLMKVKDWLMQYQEYAIKQADSMGKRLSGFVINGDDISVNRDRYYAFFKSLIHVIRNILQYAIEPPELRTALGKPEEALITCDMGYEAGGFYLIIEDDGMGIDLEQVEEQALSQGLLHKGKAYTQETLIALLFQPGFSTSTESTRLSGRGIGLCSVKEEVDELGGTIDVRTEAGLGTTFVFHLPI